MTRAKDQLHLIVPQRFYTHQQARSGDRHVYASRTRFIPCLDHGDVRGAGLAGLAARRAGASARPQARIDVGARMRGMWKRA